jgi:hypothetical protein
MATGMLGDEAQAMRARGRDEDGPAQQRVAHGLACMGSKHTVAQRAAAAAAAVAWRGRRDASVRAQPAMGAAASCALARACAQGACYSSSRQHACAHLNNNFFIFLF